MNKSSQNITLVALSTLLMFIPAVFTQSQFLGLLSCLLLTTLISLYSWKYYKDKNSNHFVFPFFKTSLFINIFLCFSYVINLIYFSNIEYLRAFHMGIQYSLGISYFVIAIALSNIFYINSSSTKILIIFLNLLASLIAFLLFKIGIQSLAFFIFITSIFVFYFTFLGLLLTENKTSSAIAIILNTQFIIYFYIYFNKHKEMIINILTHFHN